MTNAVLLTAAEALGKLSVLKLPVRVSYRIAKAVLAVQRAAEPFDMAKASIIGAHGTAKEDKPGWVTFSPEGVAAFNELLECECECDAEPLSVADLEGAEIEPAVLVQLGPLLKDEG